MQSTLIPYLAVWGLKPDLMLLVVVSWTLLRGSGQGILWSATGGLLLDLLSSGPFGLCSVALVCVAALTGLGEMNILRLSLALPLIAAALATICYDAMLLVGLHLVGKPVIWSDALLRVIAPSIIVNVLVMPIVFGAMRWIHRRTGPEEISW